MLVLILKLFESAYEHFTSTFKPQMLRLIVKSQKVLADKAIFLPTLVLRKMEELAHYTIGVLNQDSK